MNGTGQGKRVMIYAIDIGIDASNQADSFRQDNSEVRTGGMRRFPVVADVVNTVVHDPSCNEDRTWISHLAPESISQPSSSSAGLKRSTRSRGGGGGESIISESSRGSAVC